MKKEIPSATYNFYGNVGNQIHHVDTMNITFDKDMNMQIQSVDEVNSDAPQQTQQPTAVVDPSSLIFKPNEQNREAIEALLKETLSISMKKSVICRKLYQQKDLYNLHQHDDTTKANIINAWLNKFGIESHFKALFSRKDFGNYYCLP